MTSCVSALIAKIDQFLDTPYRLNRREWLEEPCCAVYLRIGPTYQFGQFVPTITLATIDVREPFQRQGIFKSILEHLIEEATQRGFALLIESVLNEHVAKTALRYGFEELRSLPGNFLLAGGSLRTNWTTCRLEV